MKRFVAWIRALIHIKDALDDITKRLDALEAKEDSTPNQGLIEAASMTEVLSEWLNGKR